MVNGRLFGCGSILTLCFLLAGGCAPGLGRQYFIGPRGNDANPGTRAKPWATLAKANTALAAGDTATFLAGQYEGILAPAADGRAGAPITYRSIRPLQARMLGVQGGPAIRLQGKHHIVLDGLHVKPTNGSWAHIADSQDVVVRNCRMEDSRTAYAAFLVERCQRLRFWTTASPGSSSCTTTSS